MAREEIPKRSRRINLKRDFWIGFWGLLLLYIGIQVLVRTNGFRQVVSDKISNGTRSVVSLERCTATPLLGLHLQGLAFSGAQMPSVRVHVDWLAWTSKKRAWVRQLDFDAMNVTFSQIPDTGRWSPLVFQEVSSKLAHALGVDPMVVSAKGSVLPHFSPRLINHKTAYQFHHSKITWRDEKGRELIYLLHINSSISQIKFGKRNALFSDFECEQIKLANGSSLNAFKLEAVKIEDYKSSIILRLSDSGGEYEGFQTETFWEDLNVQLNSLSAL